MMSPREVRLCELLAPSVEGLGYELAGVELGTAGGRPVLRVFIDREAGITLEDCERSSREIAAVLDVEDPIPESYVLEVSSPGIDRPLFTEDHFLRFAGRRVRLRAREPVDGRRAWKGCLVGCREGNVVVREGSEERSIPFGLVGKANLVPEV